MSLSITSHPSENRLLVALPYEIYQSLLPDLEPISLPFKKVLYESGELIDYVYFPNDGVVSLLTSVADGTNAEVGLVGNEGMVGLPVFLGVSTMLLKAVVQVPGDAVRMQTKVFQAAVTGGGPLHNLLLGYTYALMLQISQSAACNSHHTVQERCCRWLLLTHERVRSNQFPLTQEFLSQMLGVRRASITVVAGRLQQAGLIRYSHGQITILDLAGLENASCNCYRLVQSELDRWLNEEK